MVYIIVFLVGAVVGAFCLHLFILNREEKLFTRNKELSEEKAKLQQRRDDLSHRERELARKEELLRIEISAKEEALRTEISAKEESLRTEISARETALLGDIASFNQRVVSYDELQRENTILKRDLQNVDVTLQKRSLDLELQDQEQIKLRRRSDELAEEYLSETRKQIARSLRPDNFVGCKERLLKAVAWCREVGFDISSSMEAQLVAELKSEFELVVRAAVEREEQAKIKAQMREEEKVRRELERVREQAEREKAAVAEALAKALAQTQDQHSAEIAILQEKLAEAEAKSQRALSMAQQTRAGNVYVISNVGSFGEEVFKIGMTRRLDPLDRISELGDASVPFPFDIHMMIACTDAPTLENAIHQRFHKFRINKTNPRKEFFKVSLDEIVMVVKEHHGEVEYRADAEALQYRQSLAMSEEDAEFIEETFERAESKDKTLAVEED